jgi:hypothetical protein
MTRLPTLWFCLCLAVQATPAEAPTLRYRVQIDLYVTDVNSVCTQAWRATEPERGRAEAEAFTMTNFKWDADKCVATAFQKMQIAGAESRGLEVKRQ